MFSLGFDKVAGLRSGLSEAASETIGDALTLKGARRAIGELGSYRGRFKKLLTTPKGRQTVRGALTKSLPSALAAAIYYKGGKRAYRALQDRSQNSYDNASFAQTDYAPAIYPSM